MISEELLKMQDDRINEMFDELKELGHKKLREAYGSGAIDSEKYSDPNSAALAKIIVTLICRSEPFRPLTDEYKKDLKNLEKFI
jgi:hypothetical protein